ncbi:coniferyl-alcohol dehydrogenase [Gynuella sunshinyii]|uniref:Dehydrogenases with different specificities (Related to short-chain alcohol dehydrogenase) n=1 Tax=Gynuella sunshinyii YC6258 TaxID=1445510 RepID=A0A0C5VQP7_9GAMM|nr:coniferyl-alcohol dehydrogenase [Gynuella sunshinyii]AJQ95718.1 dehydrogenases with different specificities (related to short-chain alcohol dehydrogenase) [Gynuella sunshinyii YC6258]
MKLQNKTIVVTGVSSGIGSEVARVARYHGANVIGVDRNESLLTLNQFFQADLGDPDAIDTLVSQLPDGIDALCNIAGVPGTAPAELVGRVNYLGLRHLTGKILPKMNAGGSVVNISSILGIEWPERLELHKSLATAKTFAEGAAWLKEHPVAQDFCYQYFKEALIVWTATEAQACFNQYDVRMNTVAPGPVMTPILGDFVTMLGQERVEKDAHRMKRPALADEVADVVAFMCSDESRWICGANIPVDGGLAATYL